LPGWILHNTTVPTSTTQIDSLIYSRLIHFYDGNFEELHKNYLLRRDQPVQIPQTTTHSIPQPSIILGYFAY
jgi:hypothetical protein